MMQQQQGMQGMMGGMRPGMPMMGYPGMQQQGMRPGMPGEDPSLFLASSSTKSFDYTIDILIMLPPLLSAYFDNCTQHTGMPGMMPGMPGMPGMQYQQQQAPQAQSQAAAHQPPSMSNEPAAKKARLEEPGSASLVEESQWLQMHPGPVTLQVAMPSDAPQFNCNGQYVSFNLQATDTVETLKSRITAANNDMPASKMKINVLNGAFLNKDKFTLAHYNIASGAVLVLGVRERGGRKK
jgi:splicing factor 3A subunit 1